MLTSVIVTQGRNLANVPNTSFYTDTEALFAVNLSYKQLYELLMESADDYYVTELYKNLSDFTADTNRSYFYSYSLPSDFYRLRLFQYQQAGGQIFLPVYKMTLEGYGNTQNVPSYRLEGAKIQLYNPNSVSSFSIFYYPPCPTLTLSPDVDVVYPASLIPEIMSYQLAIEIRRKQKLDTTLWDQRKAELMETFRRQIVRDENKAETIKDTFRGGFYYDFY